MVEGSPTKDKKFQRILIGFRIMIYFRNSETERQWFIYNVNPPEMFLLKMSGILRISRYVLL